ncbi:MAG: hypothetical protein LBD86_02860 [Spirochaetaceae bacterium]|nr:hypothetical protein [Spirochaetaceae bacterium]
MQITRKAAVSLLICVLLFAGFCIFAFTGLFDTIETRFYDRAILNELNNELAENTSFIDSYISELQKRFSDLLLEDAVRKSFWVNQGSEDIYERSRIFASLGVSMPGLQWVRFVDSAGNRIHYSTNPDDQLVTNDGTILYKNYPEVTGYRPFDQQMLSGIDVERILFDSENERLIFYYPFYDSMDIRRGEALFSLSIRAFSERLAENGQIKVSDNVSVISDPNGIVIGISSLEIVSVKEAIASVWTSGGTAISRIYVPSFDPLTLLSLKTSQGIFIGHILPEKLFAFPDMLKALLAAAVFITLFVFLFLVLNAKPDAVAIVQNRLKELQVSLMHEYYQLMGDMDWAVWRRELEQRRTDVKNELCRGIKIKKGSGIEAYINSFFNRSWDSLLAAIGNRTGMITTFDETKLEAILNRVLTSRPSYSDDDFKSGGQQKDFFEEIHSDGTDIEYDGIEELEGVDEETPVAGPGEHYADIEELEGVDEETPVAGPGEHYADIEELEGADGETPVAGPEEHYDGIEELEGADGENPVAGPGEHYDGIEELEGADGENPVAGPEEHYDGIEELEPADDSGYSPDSGTLARMPDAGPGFVPDRTGGGISEDTAWLNLAGETVGMRPAEIWAELADGEETPETTQKAPGKYPPLFNSRILEQDPFEDAPFDGTGSAPLATAGIPGYGEFIPTAADLNKLSFNIDPLYDVEEFDRAEDGEDEELHHDAYMENLANDAPVLPGDRLNIDKIASQIEFAAESKRLSTQNDDFKLDVRSPVEEMFSKRALHPDKVTAPARTKAVLPAAGKATKKAREVNVRNPAGTVLPAQLEPHYRFFSQKSGELEYFEAAEDETGISLIKKRDGVDYIDPGLLKKAGADSENIDPGMKSLVDSVLRNR